MVTKTAKTRRSGSAARSAPGGVTLFAAVLLVIAGLLDVLRGISALAEDEVYIRTPDYVFKFDLTGWGVIELILGIVAIAVGIGLLQGMEWARMAGVALAGLLIVTSFLFLPYFPFWSIVLIALYGFIIWGLCTHDGGTGDGRGATHA